MIDFISDKNLSIIIFSNTCAINSQKTISYENVENEEHLFSIQVTQLKYNHCFFKTNKAKWCIKFKHDSKPAYKILYKPIDNF